jgi:AcrR family transcriptional regulator
VGGEARTGLRQRLDLDERRARLIEVGQRVFSERAYDEVSIDDLARAAGVSKGLLYHYFANKRGYYVACLQGLAEAMLAETLEAVSRSLPPLEQLRAGLDAYLSYVDRHARGYAAVFRGGVGSDPEVAAVIDATRTAFLDRLLDGAPEVVAIGARQHPLLRTALRGWIGFVEAASLDWLERRDLGQRELRELLADVFVASVDRALLGPRGS